jgi:hypothetical protein
MYHSQDRGNYSDPNLKKISINIPVIALSILKDTLLLNKN